jgi:hypothetical protein
MLIYSKLEFLSLDSSRELLRQIQKKVSTASGGATYSVQATMNEG